MLEGQQGISKEEDINAATGKHLKQPTSLGYMFLTVIEESNSGTMTRLSARWSKATVQPNAATMEVVRST